MFPALLPPHALKQRLELLCAPLLLSPLRITGRTAASWSVCVQWCEHPAVVLPLPGFRCLLFYFTSFFPYWDLRCGRSIFWSFPYLCMYFSVLIAWKLGSKSSFFLGVWSYFSSIIADTNSDVIDVPGPLWEFCFIVSLWDLLWSLALVCRWWTNPTCCVFVCGFSFLTMV